jgi:CubicO group peptidase (beta-lactamase class C family)
MMCRWVGGSVRHGAASLLLVAAVLARPGIVAAQEAFPGAARLDGEIRRVMEALEIPGLALAVVKDDRVVLARGYGVREVGGTGVPVDENTLFAVGSTSKAFTAAAVGMLVDEGRVRWDDPATLHLPELQLHDPYATRNLTVRDLLSHRSGLGRRADALWYGTGYDRSELLRRIRYLEPLPSGFRGAMGYQNIMYMAAGEVVGRVSDSSWDDFVKERIFAPLGMENSGTSSLELPSGGNVAMPHVMREDDVVSVPYRNLDNVGPAGSINSSVAEMARWVRLLLNGGELDGHRLLSDSVHRELFQPNVVSPVAGQLATTQGTHFRFYGLGWVLEEYRGHVVAWHNGGIDGMHAQVALLPSERVGVVVLVNFTGTGVPEALAYRVLDLHLGEALERDWVAEQVEGAQAAREAAARAEQRLAESRAAGTRPTLPLHAYGGSYESDLYGRVSVREEGRRLLAEDFAGRRATLEHWHYDTFRATWEDPMLGRNFVTFGLDAAGSPALLTMEAFQPGRFRRVPDEGRSG